MQVAWVYYHKPTLTYFQETKTKTYSAVVFFKMGLPRLCGKYTMFDGASFPFMFAGFVGIVCADSAPIKDLISAGSVALDCVSPG